MIVESLYSLLIDYICWQLSFFPDSNFTIDPNIFSNMVQCIKAVGFFYFPNALRILLSFIFNTMLGWKLALSIYRLLPLI